MQINLINVDPMPNIIATIQNSELRTQKFIQHKSQRLSTNTS